MTALVTGAAGFVGRHLLAELPDAIADDALDVTDPQTIRRALENTRPSVIYHLAAQTFVPEALADPSATYLANVTGVANLTQAVRAYVAERNAPMPRIVFASSAEVYGRQPATAFPLVESTPLNPGNPYAASKAAAEMLLLGEARSFGLDVVIVRSFNLIGPGQSARFVVPDFAKQLATIAAGGNYVMHVGNLDAKRDFLHVRDAARAYVALAERGASGEAYNVSSGVPRAIKDVLRELILAAHVPVEVREDPQRMRPSDTPLFVGDNTKVREATDWEPKIPFRAAIREIYESARALREGG